MGPHNFKGFRQLRDGRACAGEAAEHRSGSSGAASTVNTRRDSEPGVGTTAVRASGWDAPNLQCFPHAVQGPPAAPPSRLHILRCMPAGHVQYAKPPCARGHTCAQCARQLPPLRSMQNTFGNDGKKLMVRLPHRRTHQEQRCAWHKHGWVWRGIDAKRHGSAELFRDASWLPHAAGRPTGQGPRGRWPAHTTAGAFAAFVAPGACAARQRACTPAGPAGSCSWKTGPRSLLQQPVSQSRVCRGLRVVP